MSTPATPIVEQDASTKTEEEPDIQITDEVLEEMWVQYKEAPNFFAQIEIAADGGFSEVDELVGASRYLTAFLAFFFVFLNAYSIISINVANITNTDSPQIFLVSKQILQETIGIENMPEFTQRIVQNDTAVLGFLELLMYSVYVMRMFWNIKQIWCPSSEMGRWVGVQELFWNSMPEAATISAVKLLNFVTPAVILPGLMDAINPGNNGCGYAIGNTAYFLFTRIIAAFVGFDAFLFKLQTVSNGLDSLLADGEGVFTCGLLAFTFLNQILGIVQLGWFVRKRIFAFIFAGEDGTLSPEEDAVKEVWESMLAMRIWSDLPPFQAIVAYLSYSDFDFQKLALETVEGKAAKAEEKGTKPKSARRIERERLHGMKVARSGSQHSGASPASADPRTPKDNKFGGANFGTPPTEVEMQGISPDQQS